MDSSKKILLVEDDTVDVMTVRRAFGQLGLNRELVVKSDGREAVDYLRAGEDLPWLILLDLNMPRMNGIEFLQERKQWPELGHVPVVVLTTSGEERDRMESYNFEIAGYVIKPLNYEKFKGVVRTTDAYWELNVFP